MAPADHVGLPATDEEYARYVADREEHEAAEVERLKAEHPDRWERYLDLAPLLAHLPQANTLTFADYLAVADAPRPRKRTRRPAPAPHPSSPYLTADEAAAFLRVSVKTLYNWKWGGRVKSSGPPGKLLFRRADLDKCLTSKRGRRKKASAGR